MASPIPSSPESNSAFAGAGQKAGLYKWVLEESKAVSVDKLSHGKFFSGDCYIILKSVSLKDGTYSHEIHYWLGKDITQDEAITAAAKALELDSELGGRSPQYREVQGNESEKFCSYFKPCIVPRPGKLLVSINNVEADQHKYVPHLYLCEAKNVVHVKEVPFGRSSLNNDDTFILDTKSKIFLFNGEGSVLKKAKNHEVVQYIKNSFHGGKCDVEIIDDHVEADEFWSHLGGYAHVPPKASFESVDNQLPVKLYCFDKGKFNPVDGSLPRDLLDNRRCYLLDCGTEVYIWVGRNTSSDDRTLVSRSAEILHQDPSRAKVHVTRVNEGFETAMFNLRFDEWLLAAKLVATETSKATSRAAPGGDVSEVAGNVHVDRGNEKTADINGYASASDGELADEDYNSSHVSGITGMLQRVNRSTDANNVSDYYSAGSTSGEDNPGSDDWEDLSEFLLPQIVPRAKMENEDHGAEEPSSLNKLVEVESNHDLESRTLQGKSMAMNPQLDLLKRRIKKLEEGFLSTESGAHGVEKMTSELGICKRRINEVEANLASLHELDMTDEIKNSNRRIAELETNVTSLTAELHKLEGSNFQAKVDARVLELDKRLEGALFDIKEMGKQIINCQEQQKIVSNRVDVFLQADVTRQNKLSEYEKSIQSNIGLLTSELAISKEALMQKILELEKMVLHLMDLPEKLVGLAEVKSNLNEQDKRMQSVLARVEEQETHIDGLKDGLFKLTQEKNILKSALLELKTGTSKKEMGIQTNENYIMLPSLKLEDDMQTRKNVVEAQLCTSNDIPNCSNWSQDENKSALRNAERERIYLEQLLAIENKYIDALHRVRELELQCQKKEGELTLAKERIRARDAKIGELVSSLHSALTRAKLFVQEPVESSGSKLEHTENIQFTKRLIPELEDLIKLSRTATEAAAMKVSALGVTLRAPTSQKRELEQQLRIIITGLTDVETKLKGIVLKSGSLEELVAAPDVLREGKKNLEGLGSQLLGIQNIGLRLNIQQQEDPTVQEENNKLIVSTFSDINLTTPGKDLYRYSAADPNQDRDNSFATRSLSAQTSSIGDVEGRIGNVGEFSYESTPEAWALVQKSTLLQDLVQESAFDKESLKSQLAETQKKLLSAEKRGFDLAQRLGRTEYELVGAHMEIKQLKKRMAEVTNQLFEKADEVFELRHCLHAYKDKILHLNSSLRISRLRAARLEEKIESLSGRYLEHKAQNHSILKHINELEQFTHTSCSKDEATVLSVSELERQLAAANSLTQDLEKQLIFFHSELRAAQLEAEKYRSEYGDEFMVITPSHDTSVPQAFLLTGKVRESREMLAWLIAERRKLETCLKESEQNFLEAAKAVESLQENLESLRVKYNLVDEEYYDVGPTDNTHERNASSKEPLVGQQNNLREAADILSLQEQVAFYRDQVVAESEEAAHMKEEMDAYALKCTALENELDDAKLNVQKLSAENDLLSSANNTVREQLETQNNMVNRRHEWQSMSNMDMEVATENLKDFEQFKSYQNEDLLIGLNHQSAIDAHGQERELQLMDVRKELEMRDAEIKILNEKIEALEIELGYYEEQFTESSSGDHWNKSEEAEKKMSLEVAHHQTHNLVQISHSETDYVESASRELEANQNKVKELQMSLRAVILEKENAFKQLDSLKKAMREMTQLKDGLQAKVFRLMEENRILHEEYEGAKKELEEMMDKLDEQVKEKSANESQLTKLQRQYTMNEQKHKEEIQNLQRETAEKDGAISCNLMEHADILIKNNDLEVELLEVRKELEDAYETMACQVAEDALKLAQVNSELGELRQKVSKNNEWEEKISGMEQKLQLLLTRPYAREVDLGASSSSSHEPGSKHDASAHATSTQPVPNVRTTVHPAYTFVAGAAVLSVVTGIVFQNQLRNLSTLAWLSRLQTTFRRRRMNV